MSFKIRVKALSGDVLTFRNVKEYYVNEGLIQFIDEKTDKHKIFSVSNCEIEKEGEI